MPKKKKIRLLAHEAELLASGALSDVTHDNATSKWLYAPSKDASQQTTDGTARTLCYRHMGDIEFAHLLHENQLPDTQPYQTLTRGQEGRAYCESYLRSNKFVDTLPTTVVEFDCPSELIERFYQVQSKIEGGTISHGLGNKAGNTLPLFNELVSSGEITWRVVLVKRGGTS